MTLYRPYSGERLDDARWHASQVRAWDEYVLKNAEAGRWWSATTNRVERDVAAIKAIQCLLEWAHEPEPDRCQKRGPYR